MITTTDITLGTLYFNGEVCNDPIIELVGSSNIAIKCIDNENGIYRVQTTDGSSLPACLTFVVRCGECSECPPKVIERCLCDVDNPCTGPCQDCVGGLCVDRCKNGEVCINNTCVACVSYDDCPCNQLCTPTGCQCPTGTTKNPLNDCCDYCQTSDDCGLCSDCINIGGVNTCVPKVCPDGVCDPTTGNCVECLTSGDCANKTCKYCDPVLKRCIAGEGQVMVGNDCIVAPQCTSDADCNDPCLACGPLGTCVPIQCPALQVPARIGGRCECVDECDCDKPGSCDDKTYFCTAIGPDTCGCLPCEGTCASGCVAPCYCSPLLNKCIANPCSDRPCITGLECGPGCGCRNGSCIPCDALSCTSSECSEVLGCKCQGLSCVADDCGNAPCTTPFDCPLGCTCDNGKCVGCSNFSCTGVNECAQQERCKCVNGDCEGDDDAQCTDVLALIKNDEQCNLTGSLSTENCCSCSPLTLAIKGWRQNGNSITTTTGGSTPTLQDCLSNISLFIEMQDDPNNANQQTIQVTVLSNGQLIILNPDLISASVTLNGVTEQQPNGNEIFIFQNCCTEETSLSLSVAITHLSGTVYIGTGVTNALTINASVTLPLSNVCDPNSGGTGTGGTTTAIYTHHEVTFSAELRKGIFNGVNVNGNPLLDDLSNPIIAENEVPTSGTVSYQAYTTYAMYRNTGNGYTFIGNSTEGPQTGLASYIGADAIVSFPPAQFNRIGVTEQVDDNTQREALSVNIEFFQSSHLIAPNGCSYRATVNIGGYDIVSDDDWLLFPTGNSSSGNGIATTITAADCRDPFFTWRKGGDIIQKRYVSGSNNIYSDLLENPPVDELKSCNEYSLEVDCSCEKTISDLVTFCNPADINFNLGNCGKSFELTSFSTCGPNMEQEFYIKGGSLDIKFLGNNPPVGQVFQSDTCISELEYGLTCDDECKKIYINTCNDYEASFNTVCDETGSNFTVTFDSIVTDSSGNTANIDKIEIGGFTLTSGTGWSVSLPWGTHTAVVYPTAGCDSLDVTVKENCCNVGVAEISRDCDGGTTCVQDPNITYEVNGVIQTDICGYVQALSPEQSATIILRKDTCPARSIVLPSLASFCCDNFTFLITQGSETTALVQVYSGGADPTLTVTPALGVTITVSQPNEFLIEGLIVGQAYQFTVNSEICGSLMIPHNQTECAIPVSLTQPAPPDCNSLVATVSAQQCTCKNGEFRTEVQDVVIVGSNVEVTFQTSIQQFDADPIAGTIIFTDHNGTETDLGCITCVKTVSFPKPIFQNCLNGMSMLVELQDDPDLDNQVTVEIQVRESGVNIATLPAFTTHELTVTGTDPNSNTQAEPNGNGIFIFPNITVEGNNVTINIVLEKDGMTYTQSVVLPAPVIAVTYNMILGDMCTDGNDLPEVPLELSLRGLELEDNCTYPTRNQAFTYNANSESVSPMGPQTIGLAPIDPLARYVKFEWSKDGSLVFTEFQPLQSILPEIHLAQGSEYEAKAICDPCEDSKEQEFCCIPTVTFDPINCLDAVDIIVEGLPGTYNLNFFGTPYVIVLAGPGITSDTVTYNGPLTGGFAYPVTLTVQGTACMDSYVYTPQETIIPVLAFSACNPGTNTFDMTVTNALPGWATTIMSGSGILAGNGVDITGIDETDPPVFYITSGTCVSAIMVGTPPTTCFSSSTAATSSSGPVSSSNVGSSSIPASSSGAASSSGTSSTLTSSSTPASSSIPGSSPAASSASPPASSPAAPSSSAAGSSSAPAASSSVAGSSAVPPSSTIVTPSSCPTILEITQTPQACTYTQQAENPDDASSSPRLTIPDDTFLCPLEVDCVVDSSCEGEVARTGKSQDAVGLFKWTTNVPMLSGDVAGTCYVYDGTSFLAIDISPGGHTGSCGCAGCGAVIVGDLTYNGSNGAAMAVAIRQAIINGICAANSYVQGTDFFVRTEFDVDEIRIGMYGKNNPVNLLWPLDLAGAPHADFNDIIMRGALGITSSQAGGHPAGNSLDNIFFPAYGCSDFTPCGLLSGGDWKPWSALNSISWGVMTVGSPSFADGTPQNNNCTTQELVATLTGGSCTPTFAWTGPGTIYSPTNQTIYVTAGGTYEVDVTGCPGCGLLEDSEFVAGGA